MSAAPPPYIRPEERRAQQPDDVNGAPESPNHITTTRAARERSGDRKVPGPGKKKKGFPRLRGEWAAPESL